MDLLLWITIGFVITGFVALVSMKRGMERKVAFIKANTESEESSTKARFVIRWIVSTTAWGIVSMILVVWWFHKNFG
ncbi:hypothetical protein ACM26V_04005 [Salipaludibacillus sp. HK11]|uniref:hypothetical protein n=1 Tax=Salipaludibacillus sp. HK11 TaxID=3394320 RepID=UPI0039FD7EEE